MECIREAQKPGAEDTLVEDSNCPSPRPGTRELCNSHKKCAKTKRHTQDFPQDIMEHLWLQSMVEYMDHKPLVNELHLIFFKFATKGIKLKLFAKLIEIGSN